MRLISINKEIEPGRENAAYKWGTRICQVEDVGAVISAHGWSPCVWARGYRSQANFIRADYLALDFDDPEMTLDEAINNIFCDYEVVIGTTKSHQKEKGGVRCDRFRVVIPFERMVSDIRTYRYIMQQVVEKYPCDNNCKDGGRFFFKCNEIVYQNFDGFQWEIPEVPEEFCYEPKIYVNPVKASNYKYYGDMPPLVRHFVEAGILINHHSRNVSFYSAACSFIEMGQNVDDIYEILDKTRLEHFPDFSQKELVSCIKSAFKRLAN